MKTKHVRTFTEVFCKLSVEGTHCWSNCDIPEVSYLAHPHRHCFGIKAYKTVTHDDRDIEFIKLKHEIVNYLRNKYFSEQLNLHVFNGMSCEMIGEELGTVFKLSKIEVNEDDENGCIVYFEEN